MLQNSHITLAAALFFMLSTMNLAFSQNSPSVPPLIGTDNVDNGEDLPILDLSQKDSAAGTLLNQPLGTTQEYPPSVTDELTTPTPVTVNQVGPDNPLPTQQADIVVLGTVTARMPRIESAEPFTTLSITVDHIYKQPKDSHFVSAETISVERYGANIKTQSGRLLTYRISGQKMPQVGQHLLIFGKRQPGITCYQLLRAYILKDGKSFSLDSVRLHPAYSVYNNVPEAELMQQMMPN